MESFGYVFEKPSINEDGKWNLVEVLCKDGDEFNDFTSKILKMFKHPDGDGRCIVLDSEADEKYILDTVHATFDTITNSIKLFPHDCRKLK